MPALMPGGKHFRRGCVSLIPDLKGRRCKIKPQRFFTCVVSAGDGDDHDGDDEAVYTRFCYYSDRQWCSSVG